MKHDPILISDEATNFEYLFNCHFPSVFYDEQFLYIQQGEKCEIITLSSIVSIGKASTSLTNLHIWTICYKSPINATVEKVNFIPRCSLLNMAFAHFLEKMNTLLPENIAVGNNFFYVAIS